MIKYIGLCINHAAKLRGFDVSERRISFEPGFNVVIGPNGSGKSTLLRAIASCRMCSRTTTRDKDKIKYVTTETLNPLVSGSYSSREEMIQGIRAMFQSHGQTVLDSLRSQSHADETIVLIDSPETGQDHENSEFIYQGLLKMAERYQVIIATNSLVFMRGGNLIDLGQQTLRQVVAATGKLLPDFDVSGQKRDFKDWSLKERQGKSR
jgi:predicted ATPase